MLQQPIVMSLSFSLSLIAKSTRTTLNLCSKFLNVFHFTSHINNHHNDVKFIINPISLSFFQFQYQVSSKYAVCNRVTNSDFDFINNISIGKSLLTQ